MSSPSSGKGWCRPTHQLSIRPTQAVLELGALPDVIHTALNAQHHANRHGAAEDRIAVALPGLHVHRGLARPGREVVLFGSEAALAAYAALDGVQTLMRRGMIRDLLIDEARVQLGAAGVAYIRDRTVAKGSPGALRRARARAERRGVTQHAERTAKQPAPEILALHFGSAVVHVRAIEAEVTDQPLPIGTYGFSSRDAPAVLPIRPDASLAWVDDAA